MNGDLNARGQSDCRQSQTRVGGESNAWPDPLHHRSLYRPICSDRC